MPKVDAEVIKRVEIPGEKCNEGDPPKTLYTETDVAGNKFEVKCDGQLLGVFTRADDKSVVYIGKCIYHWGQNYINKKVLMSIEPTVTSVGEIKIEPKKTDPDYLKPKEMQTITWKNIEPSGDPPKSGKKGDIGPEIVGAKDILWIYDVKSNTYITQKTENKGHWKKIGDGDDDWIWEVEEQKKLGDPSAPKAAPKDPKLLSMAGETPHHGSEPCFYIPPQHYVATTPVPFTFEQNGVMQTCIARLPVDANEFEVSRIEATANREFTFQIEMPHQQEETVSYALLEPPHGMTIDRLTGVIKWKPTDAHIGHHIITVRHAYHGLTPHLDRFTLRVKPGSEG